ncbi:MAG TPA: hypothetical protein VIJ25_03195, partial [Methylococcales bacterium]
LPSSSARNLGFIFDNHLSFSEQISSVSRSCFLHIRDLRRVRPTLNYTTASTIATSLVHSKLDYCNSLYLGLPATQLNRLQRIQNTLARTVVSSPKFSHASPIIRSLHWLKINERIQYKVISTTFKTIATSKPSYLRSLLTLQPQGRTRSSSYATPTLVRPPTGSKLKLTDRSFRLAAPKLWNQFLHDIMSSKSYPISSPSLLTLSYPVFHSKLKSYLFAKSHPS